MISGIVNASREAALLLTVFDSIDQPLEISTVVDTGFNGYLTLPPDLIVSLGLRWLRIGRAYLADGSEILTNIYEGTALWDGHRLSVSVSETDGDPLVGMSLMYGFELVLPVLDGAAFTLRRIANP